MIVLFAQDSTDFEQPLTVGEQKYVQALEKYAKKFPNDPKSSRFLFDAAIVYHNKKNYSKNKENLNYIIENYPNSSEVKKAYEMLYLEHFELGEFVAAERVMKQLERAAALSADEKNQIQQKKFLAAFKSAETQKDEATGIVADTTSAEAKKAQLKRSADEFLRAARENPEYKDAVQAVWNAAYYYSEAKEWDSVYVSYNYLIDRFKGQKNSEGIELSALAMNSLGYLVTDTLFKYDDYKGPLFVSKKENSRRGADYLKRFTEVYPEFKQQNVNLSQIATDNSAYYYTEAGFYLDAIRMHRKYLDLYANQISAQANVDRLREMAKLYMKLGNEEKAFAIYDELGTKYPDAPFAVEGYYERATYYLAKGDKATAKKDFTKCYELSKNLQNKGIENYGGRYAAEALFILTDWEREEYEKITIDGDTRNAIARDKKQKEEMLNKLSSQYAEVIEYGTKEYGLASIRRAQLAEEYADATFNQTRLNYNKKEDELVAELQIDNEAILWYQNSINAYTDAINNMDGFVSLWEKVNQRDIAKVDSLISENPDDADLLIQKKRLENDSIATYTLELKERAKTSVLKMQYTLANVYKNLAQSYMSMNPGDLGYNENDPLFYEEAFTWIETQGVPLVDNIIQAHQKTLIFANEFGIPNSPWVQKSKDEIASSADIVIAAYLRLADMLTDMYMRMDEYVKKTNSYSVRVDDVGLTIVSRIKVDGRWTDVFTFHQRMELITDYLNSAITRGLESYDKNFIAGRETLSKKEFDEFKRKYLERIFNRTEKVDELLNYAKTRQNELSETLNEIDRLYEMYEYNGAEYIDTYLLQADNLRMIVDNLYEIAFAKIKEYDISNFYTQKIFNKLITRKPWDYYFEFGLGIEKKNIVSNTDWKAIPVEQKGYYNKDFDTKDWIEPYVVQYTENIENDSIFVKNQAKPIWVDYSEEFEKFNVVKNSSNDETKKIHYFRKDFYLEKIPVSAKITIAADDKFGFFVNGITQFDMILKNMDTFDTFFYGDTSGWNKGRTWVLTEALKQGHNAVVIYALDLDNTKNGVTTNIEIETLDKVVTEDTYLSLEGEEEEKSELDPEKKKLHDIYKKGQLE